MACRMSTPAMCAFPVNIIKGKDLQRKLFYAGYIPIIPIKSTILRELHKRGTIFTYFSSSTFAWVWVRVSGVENRRSASLSGRTSDITSTLQISRFWITAVQKWKGWTNMKWCAIIKWIVYLLLMYLVWTGRGIYTFYFNFIGSTKSR